MDGHQTKVHLLILLVLFVVAAPKLVVQLRKSCRRYLQWLGLTLTASVIVVVASSTDNLLQVCPRGLLLQEEVARLLPPRRWLLPLPSPPATATGSSTVAMGRPFSITVRTGRFAQFLCSTRHQYAASISSLNVVQWNLTQRITNLLRRQRWIYDAGRSSSIYRSRRRRLLLEELAHATTARTSPTGQTANSCHGSGGAAAAYAGSAAAAGGSGVA